MYISRESLSLKFKRKTRIYSFFLLSFISIRAGNVTKETRKLKRYNFAEKLFLALSWTTSASISLSLSQRLVGEKSSGNGPTLKMPSSTFTRAREFSQNCVLAYFFGQQKKVVLSRTCDIRKFAGFTGFEVTLAIFIKCMFCWYGDSLWTLGTC